MFLPTILLGALLAPAGSTIHYIPPNIPPCPGDANGDFEANLTDVALILQCMQGPASCVAPKECAEASADFDDDVDLRDFAQLQNDFGSCDPCAPQWWPGFGPTTFLWEYSSAIGILEFLDFGCGPELLVGGGFRSIGSSRAQALSSWNGRLWKDLGLVDVQVASNLFLLDDGYGDALFVSGKGRFNSYVIFKRLGETWKRITGWPNNLMHETLFDDGTGETSFAIAGESPEHRLWKWDGNNWIAISGVISFGRRGGVNGMAVFDDGNGPSLYIGGAFQSVEQMPVANLAKWDGHSWSSVGTGVNGIVNAITVCDDGYGEKLYIGGELQDPFNSNSVVILRWDGKSWSSFEQPLENGLFSVKAFSVLRKPQADLLFAGGLTRTTPDSGHSIARWNGIEWTVLDVKSAGLPSLEPTNVSHLTAVIEGGSEALYAVGRISSQGQVAYASSNEIVKWTRGAWSYLDPGRSVTNTVRCFSTYNDGTGEALYAAGDFVFAGPALTNRVARWDGVQWRPLGIGTNNAVFALAPFDDGSGPGLFVGGAFTTAGNVECKHIARWNGSKWSSLGTGTDFEVHAMATYDDGTGPSLFASGAFTSTGNVNEPRIARWDGSEWSAVGTGITDGVVEALAVFDSGDGPELFAGGRFLSAGDGTRLGVAKWNGMSWSGVGDYGDQAQTREWIVNTLYVYQDETAQSLYAGGRLIFHNEHQNAGIAKWDGLTWSPIDGGWNINAFEFFDDGDGLGLFAAGAYDTWFGADAYTIGKWDGNGWVPLSWGIGGEWGHVFALKSFDDGTGPALFVGGAFQFAGHTVSSHIAKWAPRRRDCP